jgi:hypothetical protein
LKELGRKPPFEGSRRPFQNVYQDQESKREHYEQGAANGHLPDFIIHFDGFANWRAYCYFQ